MKIILAPDSFKGSLTSHQVIDGIDKAARKNFEDCEIVRIPIADGGEGTVAAMVEATGGEIHRKTVTGPLGEPIEALYGVIHGDTAVVEMAAASGLPLVPKESRNIMKATSFGTGELIKEVLEKGFRKVIIAVGGSATNDGGIGAMTALGAEFLDESGNKLEPVGENLEKIFDYTTDGLPASITETEFTVMCDVDNPLVGPFGATYVYGPQKGGTKETLEALEHGMQNYADVLKRKTGTAFHEMPGAGAAGGISAALVAFLGAKLQSGISVVLEASQFEQLLQDADLVITGEGRADSQSARGKVLYGIGMKAKTAGVPVMAIVGGMLPGAEALYECGIGSVMVTVNGIMDLEQAIEEAPELLESAADRMFRIMKIGKNL